MSIRSGLASAAVVLALLLRSCAVQAGDPCATFSYRLTCPYSSFVEARVSWVLGSRACAKVTRNLLRKPGTSTIFLSQSSGVPREQHLKKGDLVLINYWTKPHKIDYTLFPNSMTWGPHSLGRITVPGKSVDAAMPWIGFPELVNWYYRTGKWDARLIFRTAGSPKDFWYRAYAVERNGTEHLIYDERQLRRRGPSVPPAQAAPSAKTWTMGSSAVVLALIVTGWVYRRHRTNA